MKKDNEEPTVDPLIAIFLFVVMLILLSFFGYIVYRVMMMSTGVLPLLAIGMLGDPFYTSRKITIEPNPDHKPVQARSSRYHQGRRERTYLFFAKASIAFSIGLLILFFVVQAISILGQH